MLSYLVKHGIQLETTAPFTPEQNGRSERDNRTLVESARSMLHAKKLPTRLWAEAMNTAAYILNRTPTSCTKGTTPYEIWTGKKPDLAHTRIFGSEVYAHIPKEQRSKWDKKARKLIFVDYQRESSNNRLYDPDSGKINVSRDVKFNKSQDQEISFMNDKISLPFGNDSLGKDLRSVKDLSLEERPEQNSDKDNPEEKDIEELNKVQRHNLRDRSKINKPSRYKANMVETTEPTTFQEALSRKDAVHWTRVIEEELSAHDKNKTWRLASLPKGRSTIGNK